MQTKLNGGHMEEDKYGSVLRESMKRSLERPAQYRRTNVREPQNVSPVVLVVFVVGILSLGFFGFLALDKIEAHYRTPAVQR